MPIVSSTVVEDRVQKDGRRSVRERHTDHLGQSVDVNYLAEAAANVQTTMTSRVASIEAVLRDAEIERNIAVLMMGESAFTFQHSTQAQNRAGLREKYRTATKWEAVVIGRGIHVQGWTDQQLSNLFNVSGQQLTALKTKLANCATKYDAVIVEAGQ